MKFIDKLFGLDKVQKTKIVVAKQKITINYYGSYASCCTYNRVLDVMICEEMLNKGYELVACNYFTLYFRQLYKK